LPPALKGRFEEEPRWIDLRSYRAGSIGRDPIFADLAADFAAEIHGVPHKGTGSAEEVTQAMSQGYFAATEAVRDFNVKLIEIAQANTRAALNFAQEVATAKSPTEAAALWSSHARKSFETFTDQTKELTALGQRVVASAVEPLSHSFTPSVGFLNGP
jgi:hypothetical protein